MKRLLAVILAVVMTLGIGVTSFAAPKKDYTEYTTQVGTKVYIPDSYKKGSMFYVDNVTEHLGIMITDSNGVSYLYSTEDVINYAIDSDFVIPYTTNIPIKSLAKGSTISFTLPCDCVSFTVFLRTEGMGANDWDTTIFNVGEKAQNLKYQPTSKRVAKPTFSSKNSTKSDANNNGKQDGFDAAYYAKTYPDVVAAIGNDPEKLYQHYINHGKAEGRKPHA